MNRVIESFVSANMNASPTGTMSHDNGLTGILPGHTASADKVKEKSALMR